MHSEENIVCSSQFIPIAIEDMRYRVQLEHSAWVLLAQVDVPFRFCHCTQVFRKAL